MFRIAHVSDLHVLASTGVELRRMIFNKRITGFANLAYKRARVYRRDFLVRVLETASTSADHLVVTGDITNLSLESEYEEAVALLREAARSTLVTVIPGNHDIYLPVTLRERRFPFHFEPFLESDLPEFALDLPAGRFPSVRLTGPAAVIGLSSAVPRPPFVSAGIVGKPQLEALSRLLLHPEVVRRTPVILVHHSPFDLRVRWEQLRGGLVDAAALRKALQPLARGLVLYGHHHERRLQPLPTKTGALQAACASAAALDHTSPRIRAGFNLYGLDEAGTVRTLEAHVLAPDGRGFETHALTPGGSPT